MKQLSIAQVRALERFAQPGGSDYGLPSHPQVCTAEALARRGLVVLYSRRSCGIRIPHGDITPEGREQLRLRGIEVAPGREPLDYPWIRRWGKLLGSKQWYIDDEVARVGRMAHLLMRSTTASIGSVGRLCRSARISVR